MKRFAAEKEVTDMMIAVWTAVMIFCLIVELGTAALVSIWFMPGAIVSLILAIADVPVTAQVIVFVVLSALLLILSRTVFNKYMKKSKFIPTNTDRLPGMEAVVTEEIPEEPGLGEVKVDGKHWSAKMLDGSKAEKGEILLVDHIESTKLICVRKDAK